MSSFREKGKHFASELLYILYKKKIIKNELMVNSIDQTIDKLIHSEESFVRFGDAEIRIIEGNTTKFQDYDRALAERLYEILQYKQEHILVGIPDIFDSLEPYTERSKNFWMEHLFFSRKTYLKYCNTSKVYENAFFSRLYYIYKDKRQSGKWFQRVKEIWKNKEIVIVEGEGTHTGVGNDLLDAAKGIERILCPALNAYLAYPRIRQACFACGKEKLFLLAVGNTAKLLVSDLAKEGYRAIDIGNLDLEYEWYIRGDKNKGVIPKNNVIGFEANEEAGYYEYLSQIKERIV